MANKPAMSYVPSFVPQDLPWYKRDDLMTWYDQVTCQDLLRDTDRNFDETKIVNCLSIPQIIKKIFYQVLFVPIERIFISKKTTEKHFKNKLVENIKPLFLEKVYFSYREFFVFGFGF